MKINYNEYKLETLQEVRKLTENRIEVVVKQYQIGCILLGKAKKRNVVERTAQSVNRVFRYEERLVNLYKEMGELGNELVQIVRAIEVKLATK